MLRKVDDRLIELQTRWNCLLQDFMEEERGESNFVAVLLIIVIAVAVATIFRSQITNLVSNVFNSVTNFTNNRT